MCSRRGAESADPVSLDAAIYEGAIPGMLRTLDPHSSFFDPEQFQQLQQMEKSEQKGFGSVVSVLARAGHRVAGFAGNALRQGRAVGWR